LDPLKIVISKKLRQLAVLFVIEFFEEQSQCAVYGAKTRPHIFLEFSYSIFKIVTPHKIIMHLSVHRLDVAAQFHERIPNHFERPAAENPSDTHNPVEDNLFIHLRRH
jgi:hypothetical protein